MSSKSGVMRKGGCVILLLHTSATKPLKKLLETLSTIGKFGSPPSRMGTSEFLCSLLSVSENKQSIIIEVQNIITIESTIVLIVK